VPIAELVTTAAAPVLLSAPVWMQLFVTAPELFNKPSKSPQWWRPPPS
jgi:hypothetical protein